MQEIVAREAGQLRNPRRRLRGDCGRELALRPHRCLQLCLFFGRHEDATDTFQRREHCVINRVDDHHAILRRAARCIVERLRLRDQLRRAIRIGIGIDDARDVARADTERRRPALVGGADVGLRPGRDDEVHGLHQRMRGFAHHRRRQDLDQVGRRTDLAQLFVNVVDQHRAGRLSLRRWRDDDRIAALERIDDLVGRRRARIRRWRDRGHHASRPRNLDQPFRRIRADDSDRLRALQITHQAERLAMVLRDLVLDVAQAGVGDRAHGK